MAKLLTKIKTAKPEILLEDWALLLNNIFNELDCTLKKWIDFHPLNDNNAINIDGHREIYNSNIIGDAD